MYFDGNSQINKQAVSGREHPVLTADFLLEVCVFTIKWNVKLGVAAIVNVPLLCDSFSIVRFFQMLPSNVEHTMPMKQQQDR